MGEQSYEMSGTTKFKTFAYMMNIAEGMAKNARDREEGSNHARTAAVLFSAFSIEAFLNDIGEQKLRYWHIVEPKMSWKNKLELILNEFGHKPDFGCRPYQTLKALFAYRDKIAHGKSIEFEATYMHHPGQPEPFNHMQPEWINAYKEDDSVARVVEDTRAIITELAEKAGLGPGYWMSISEGSYSSVQK